MLKIFTDPRCLAHQAPVGYPECPRRLESILERVRAQNWELDADMPDLSDASWLDAVCAVHDGDYVERFRRAVERGDGLLDSADNPLCRDTWDAVLAAVASGLRAADWMMQGEQRRPFVAVRPPGHHAEKAQAMGFCFFDTVAVVAQHLLDRHDLERVLVLDFDVHHGNGTQHLFEDRADVVFLSLHQFPFYPGSGARHERGVEAGQGATLNVPLAAGSDDAVYEQAWSEEILPAMRQARPEALLISAGFDAWQGDPLGGMTVSLEGYRRWGRLLRGVAEELTDGRCFSILEGGYDLEHLPSLVEAYVSGLEEGPA